MKIAVGLSGGVDSSVAAYLLQQQGHEVIGVTMKLFSDTYTFKGKGNACFSPDESHDISDVERVCSFLSIPLYVIDCSKHYHDTILTDFSYQYRNGKTPNPCVLCNSLIKFTLLPELLRSVHRVDFEKFATGHYCRIFYDATTQTYFLKRAVDQKKDQSYFLYRLQKNQLPGILFPLGELTKIQVRAIAHQAQLPVADKPESQDFYSGKYEELFDFDQKQGNIVDQAGTILGVHSGIGNYTIGQRKGLGIAVGTPLYVVEIRPLTNEIVVGEKNLLFSRGLVASQLNIFSDLLTGPFRAQIRSTSAAYSCSFEREDDSLTVHFDQPQSAVTPGQSVVVYENDIVYGGGIISSVHHS